MVPEVQIQLNQTNKPWFKRPWFISIVVLVVLWFGIPLLLRVFNIDDNNIVTTPSPEINLPMASIPITRLETSDDPWQGSPVAPLVIVEFGDFQCPFCKEAAPILKEVLKRYPEAVKFIYRDFPVSSIHSEAITAAEAANCAYRQGKFWQYHDALFERQDDLGSELYLALAQSLRLDTEEFSNCLSQHQALAEIQSDFSDGVAAGVSGTPAWFVNGRKIEGVLTLELWQKLIDYLIISEFKQKASQ